jgi:hypothetical protein
MKDLFFDNNLNHLREYELLKGHKKTLEKQSSESMKL